MAKLVRDETTPYLPGSKTLDRATIATWLWEAACKIRGPVDAPKYKDYILPLIFLKRVSDVFDDEIARLGQELGSEEVARQLAEQDHSLVRFYLPIVSRWGELLKTTVGLGQRLTDAMRALAKQNPRLSDVLETLDFNVTHAGERIVSDDQLSQVMQTLTRHRLGLHDVQADIVGDSYEYLLRKFAEGGGQSAGEFYTPREVAMLLARLLDPQPGMEVYDPCCGSGGLLIKSHLRLLENHGVTVNGHRELPPNVPPLRLYGQEILPATFAMAKMNVFIHGMESAEIARGDTMNHPRFLTAEGGLRAFDRVTANPMWNQDVFSETTYKNDAYGRFVYGYPPNSSADWGWIQHMLASLRDTGRMAVVLDSGAVSRGSGNTGSNRERDIRKKVVEAGLVEGVILLPENLFYNTTAPGIILVLRRGNPQPDEVVVINASELFRKGRPKNELTEEHVDRITAAFQGRTAEQGLSAVLTREQVAGHDYNLSPSRYVSTGQAEDVLPLEEAVVLLREAEEERAEADRRLKEVLESLGLA